MSWLFSALSRSEATPLIQGGSTSLISSRASTTKGQTADTSVSCLACWAPRPHLSPTGVQIIGWTDISHAPSLDSSS